MMNNRLYRALVLSEPQLTSALSIVEFVARHALPARLVRRSGSRASAKSLNS